MDITFLITTYNRRESCQRLVDSLQGLGDVVVLGDNVDYTISGCKFVNSPQHYGKSGYWFTVKRLFLMRGKHQYYMMLPDDFIINVTQVTEAIRIWESIEDPQKICLNLFMDRRGVRCWTNFFPIDRGVVWQTGWVDMCFLCEESFFRNIKLRFKRCNGGSGVGAQISRQLFNKKFHFYQVKESLVTPQNEHGISQMHANGQDNDRNSVNTAKRKVYDTRRRSRQRPVR